MRPCELRARKSILSRDEPVVTPCERSRTTSRRRACWPMQQTKPALHDTKRTTPTPKSSSRKDERFASSAACFAALALTMASRSGDAGGDASADAAGDLAGGVVATCVVAGVAADVGQAKLLAETQHVRVQLGVHLTPSIIVPLRPREHR